MQDHVQMYRSLLQSIADYSQECLGILEQGAGDLPQWTNDIISRTRAWMKDVTHFLRGQDNRGVRYGSDYHGRAYMATKNLREIHEYALESLSYMTGDGILPPWVEKKISVCEEYMDLVGHWLENEYVEGRRYGSYLNPVPGDAGDEAYYRGQAAGIRGESRNPYPPNNVLHKIYNQAYQERVNRGPAIGDAGDIPLLEGRADGLIADYNNKYDESFGGNLYEQGFNEGYGTKERRYGARGGSGGGGAGAGAAGAAGGGAGARGGPAAVGGGRAAGGGRPGGGRGRGRGEGRGRGHRRGGHHRPHAHGRHIHPYYPQPYYYIQPIYEPIPVVLEASTQEVAVAPILTEVKAKLRDPKPGEGISQRGVIELRGLNLNVIEGIGIVYAYDNEGLLGGDTGPHTSQVKIINIGPNALVFELPVGPASHMMITDIAYFAYGQSRSLAQAFFDIVPYPFQPFQGGRRRYGAETSRPSKSPGASRPRPSGERPGGKRPGDGRPKTPSVGLTRQPQTSTLTPQEPQTPALTHHPGIERIDPPPPSGPMLPSEMTQFMPPNRMVENHRGILHHRQLGQDTGRRFGVPGFVAGEPGWAGNAGVAQSPHPTRRIRRSAPEDPTFGPDLSAGQGGLQPWPGGGAMGKETYGSLGYGSMGIGSMDRAVQSSGARFSGTRKKPKKGRMFNTRKRKKR